MSVAVTWCTAMQIIPHKWSSLYVYYFIITVMLDDAEKINIEIKKCLMV